jgi:hypothetical protein
MRLNEQYNVAGSGVHVGMHTTHHDGGGVPVQGELFIRMVDTTTGEVLHAEHRKNLIVLDAGILVAMLCRSPASRPTGINMLAVGTGATGALLSPNAPDNRQRKLNAEIARKGFSSTVFRDGSGVAVAYPTNIVDFTCTFGEAEAVGPINEMGLLSTISSNPAVRNPNPNTFPTRDTTVDVSTLDILVNYISLSVLSKPSTATLTITWRITF